MYSQELLQHGGAGAFFQKCLSLSVVPSPFSGLMVVPFLDCQQTEWDRVRPSDGPALALIIPCAPHPSRCRHKRRPGLCLLLYLPGRWLWQTVPRLGSLLCSLSHLIPKSISFSC